MPEIILTASPHGPVTAYDPFSGATLARFSGSRSPRHGLALAGTSYIAASHISSSAIPAPSIHLYNWWSTTAFHHLPVPEPVAPLAATPDGSHLFAGGLSGHLHALSIPSGNIITSLPAHSKPISCLAITNDSSLLVSGGDDGIIIVVPIFLLVERPKDQTNSSSLILHRFVAHDGPVTDIVCCMGFCHPTIISCSMDCTCKLWSLLDGVKLKTVSFPCPISGIALDPTETEFYAAGSDGLIYRGCLKVRTRKEVSRGLELVTWGGKHSGAVVSVAMVNEGKSLVSAAEDGFVYAWEVETGQVSMVLGNNMAGISDLMVATGIADSNRHSVAGHKDKKEYGGESAGGLSGKELSGSAKGTVVDMEDALSVTTKDRGKAIDMLESAIEIYERLLELILKEAKKCTTKNSDKQNDEQ